MDTRSNVHNLNLNRRAVVTGIAAGTLMAAGALANTAASPAGKSPANALAGQASPQASPATTPIASNAVTVVLMHGAWADGASWSGVIGRLQAAGIPVIAPANPLRGIASDAAYLTGLLGVIPGRVLLVGHSYGGAVITAAAPMASNVAGLVYAAAFAPDEGEVILDVLGKFTPTALGTSLRPTTAATDPLKVEVVIDAATFPQIFAADLPAETSAIMAVSQRPVAAAAFAEPAPAAGWKTLPSWYALTTKDQALGVEVANFYAKRAGSTIVEVDSSHAIAVSNPQAVVDVITTALGTLG